MGTETTTARGRLRGEAEDFYSRQKKVRTYFVLRQRCRRSLVCWTGLRRQVCGAAARCAGQLPGAEGAEIGSAPTRNKITCIKFLKTR
jgi:hypothetical protein